MTRLEFAPARRLAALVLLFSVGFGGARADEWVPPELSDATILAYGRADRAIRDLDGFLRALNFERPAVIGVNYFAVSCGGVDALRDLEEGRGVDPETLAGLQAGFAIPAVAQHLNLEKIPDGTGGFTLKIDARDGRLRYKGTVVRLYSRDRLREMFARRDVFSIDQERRRKDAITEFVGTRKRELGGLQETSSQTDVDELADRYLQVRPLVADLEAALRSEAGANSILQGTSQNFYALSVGGINVLGELDQRSVINPETLAAIYADRVSADFAESFQLNGGRVLYNGAEVQMYSANELLARFRYRDKLVLRSTE